MANTSGERLAEALRTIFDENMDATESFLSEKNESGLGIRSAGRSRVGKSMKGKTKSFQQNRYPDVPDECLEDVSDNIFGSASLKGNDQSCAMHGNVGSDVSSYETKNSNSSLQAKALDLSSVGNEDVQFATNLPPKDLPKKGKKFDSSFKTCSSTSIPPDEVVIEAMKLIFDENVDASRIFALDKKESTRLDSSSHGEDRVSGKVKIKAKQKRYRSVLDDLLDDNSDDIFGPAFANTNKGAPVAEMKGAEGEVEQCKLTAEESVDSNREFVPENTMISGKKDGEHTVDICFDSSESKLLLKQDSDAASDSVSSVAAAQGLHCCSEVELNDSTMSRKDVEDQENVSDLKLNLCLVEQITEDESYLASSDDDANLKVPFDSEVTFPGTEINDLPASQKVTEIYLPKQEVIKNDVSSSSPNKRKQNGISNGYDELDTISSGFMSEEMEDVNPSKKRKHTGLALESELMRNVHTDAENMLVKIPNFNFVSHTGSDQTFTGRQRNVEETAKDEEREEKFSHLRGTRSSKSKPCQPIFRFEDNEIETLFGSGRNKSMTSVETKSDRNVVKQATETMISTKDIDLDNRISDPLLNTESSDNEELHLNTDLQRSRKPERTENHREDLSLTDTGVLLTRSLESCSDSAQDKKFTAEYPLQQIPLKSGQDGTCSFIFQLPSECLPNVFLLCAAGILLVAVPSLLILVPVYILALFNAIFITCLLMVGAMVFMIYCGKEKKHVRNTITHGTSVEHLQLPDIKYFKSPDDVFKGWMNELSGSYDVSNFHISHLRSVYVSLDGRTLRLRTPKKRIPKRSVCSDTTPTPGSFIKQRFYDLSGSKVTTLPEGLVLRRLWSKKYPILIEIPVGQTNKGKPVLDQTGGCEEGTELENLHEKNFTRLFLFARTCREKEEWFHRLFAASSSSVLASSCSKSSVKNTPLEISIQPSVSEAKKDSPCELEPPKLLTKSDDQNFSDYLSSMSKVLSLNNESVCDPQLLWINAFISRCTMDVLQESHWIEVIKRKLDKKLLTAKIPFFMDDVRLVEFDLGKEVPFICKATLPSLDDQGLWMDLEVTYRGRLSFTIETKCNLLKLKGMSPTDMPRVSRRSSAATNSDEEDSGESSTGDSSDNEEYNDPERQKPRVNWLLRLADRITSSRHFQNALKIDRIKKLMESVSSKSLMLSVEVHSIKGTLAVNIPPPPTDRIWYGFRHMPELEMSVEVQVGQRQIALTPLTSWIEKKLIVELERALVMPNMDDILFPLMCDHVTNAHVRTTGNSE